MIQKPRGTKDIYGNDEGIYKFIFSIFEKLAHAYNFEKIVTPMFESYELFKETTGETSDIISKEIYTFQDFGNRLLALRPEGTASAGRAIIENKLYLEKKYNKLYYMGSMFRYEKPQKGRMRQFYQIGVEITNELNNQSILESIVMANNFLKNLNINSYTLYLNNLGLKNDREIYINELKNYFRKHEKFLSEKSRERIEVNPLRILDDKEEQKLDVVKNAPKINQFWSFESKKEFEQLLKMLDYLNIKYEVDYSLVRGLDYYSNTVYEFVSFSSYLGSKTTIIGGGCYLNLINSQNFNQINGVGFACGVERIYEIIKNSQNLNFDKSVDVFWIIEEENNYKDVLPIIYKMRNNGICVEFNYFIKNYKKLFNDAKYFNSKIIIFKDLMQKNTDNWTIKCLNNNTIVNLNKIYKTIVDVIKFFE